MTVSGLLKLFGLGLVGAAALWLTLPAGWCDDMLVRSLARFMNVQGPVSLPSDLFPEGMPFGDAFRLLARNGFFCVSGAATSNGNQLVACKRSVSHFPCGGTFSVQLQLNNANLVVDRTATSIYVCV
jgi:hypothetical protein